MEVKFYLETLGWMVGEINDNSVKVKVYHSSTFGDKFQEFLNLIFILKKNIDNNNNLFFPCNENLVWRDEFVLYKLNLGVLTTTSPLSLSITKSYVENPLLSESIFKGSLSFQEMLNCIYESLNQIISEYGFVGYKNAWEIGNFPISEFIQLRKEKLNIILPVSEVSDDQLDWQERHLFYDELKCLKDL